MSNSDEFIDVPVNAEVHCKDGRCGTSKMVIINPTTKTLTSIVVEFHDVQYLVPRELVAATTPDLIVLGCSREDVTQSELFVKNYFLDLEWPEAGVLATEYYLLEPTVFLQESVVIAKEELIPIGEMAIRRSNVVHAKDGDIGAIDEFVVDRDTGSITHVILREGHLWGQMDIAIPVGSILKAEAGEVHLSLTKKEIVQLPKVPVERWWE